MRSGKILAPFITIGALVLVLAVIVALSLWVLSPIRIEPDDLITALFPAGRDVTVGSQVIDLVRLPRALGGCIVGASLAIAGLLMQGATRNRLASPTLLGVTGGASLGLALASSGLLADMRLPSGVAATLGGALAWGLVFLLGTAWSLDASKGRLILAGMTMAALCAGLTRLIVLLAEERALGVLNWLAGSLANIRYNDLPAIAVVFGIGFAASSLIAPKLNLINLGDEAAQSLGVRVGLVRLSTFAIGSIMVGATVSLTGPISFIGLMAPNIARAIVGNDYRILLPASAVLGSILLVASDIVARGVAFPSEIAAGAVTTLVGAPFFLLLARKIR